MRASFRGAFQLLMLVVAVGCGGPSQEHLAQSEREYRLGVGLFQDQDHGGAFQHLLEAIRLDETNVDAHLMLGNLYTFRGEYAAAERHLLEAIRLSRGEESGRDVIGSALNSLGVLYVHSERLDDAIRVLTEASQDLLNQRPWLAWANLSWARYLQDDHNGALEAARRSVQLMPGFCLGWYRVALPLAALERPEQAEYALSRALDVENETCQANQLAWRLRGELLAGLSRRDEAVDAFERCVEIDSSSEAGAVCRRILDESAE